MKEYNVLNVSGRVNAAGQPVECLRCVSAELALDRTGVNGANLPYLDSHILRLKFVSFANSAAHGAGRPHDPTAALDLDIDIAERPELAAAFETAFAAALPVAAAKLGATVGTVGFDVSDAVG